MATIQVTVAQMLANAANPGFSAGGNTYQVVDTAANIQALTPAQIAAAPSVAVTGFTTTGQTILTVSQALSFEQAGQTLTTAATTYSIIIQDSAANLEALTLPQISGLAALNIVSVSGTDKIPVFSQQAMQYFNSTGATNGIAVVGLPGSNQTDGTTVVKGANGGMTFDIIWDASVASAPTGYKAAVEAAFQVFANTFTDPNTVYFTVGYGEVGGFGMPSKGVLGDAISNTVSTSYASLTAALKAGATSAVQNLAVANLPSTDPTGGSGLQITTAEANVLGLPINQPSSPQSTDGAIGMAANGSYPLTPSALPNQTSNPTQYDLLGVTEHEIAHVLGRISLLGSDTAGVISPTGLYTPLDLFRYSAPGVLQSSPSGTPAYFSLNGGTTNLANFNSFSPTNAGDLADWAGTTPYTADSFNNNSNFGVNNALTSTDVSVINSLGYGLTTPAPVAPLSAPVNTLLFDGQDANGNNALWASDGSAGGTHELVGVNFIAGDLVTASDITALGKQAIFNGQDLHGNNGLWVSNGTTAGTYELTGIANAPSTAQGGFNPKNLTQFNGKLWFTAIDANGLNSLWQTDGTSAGTHEMVAGIGASDLGVYNGKLVYAGPDGGLWQTDGTQAGASEIIGAPGSALAPGTPITVNNANAATISLPSAYPNAAVPSSGFNPSDFTVVDGQLIFSAWVNTSHGLENALMSYNGSSLEVAAVGPYQVVQPSYLASFSYSGPALVPYATSALVNHTGLVTPEVFYQIAGVGNSGPLYATANLQAYDPATGLTTAVTSPGSIGGPVFHIPVDLITAGNVLVFNGAANGITIGANDLFVSNGFAPGTVINGVSVAGTFDLAPYITGANATGIGLNPQDLTVFDGNIYFNGVDSAGKQVLFELATNNGNFYGTNLAGAVSLDVAGAPLSSIAGASVNGLNPTNLTALSVAAPTAVAVTVGGLLNDITLNQIDPTQGAAPAGSAYVISDTAIDIEGLTGAEITKAISLGLTAISVTDGSLILSVEQALALEGQVTISVPPGSKVTVLDTSAAIAALTPAQLGALTSLGVTTVTQNDGAHSSVSATTINVQTALALEGPPPTPAPAGVTLSLVDLGQNIQNLTQLQLSELAAIGVGSISASSESVYFQSFDQIAGLANSGLAVQVSAGQTVYLEIPAAALQALTPAQIEQLGPAGVSFVLATDTAATLSLSQAIAFASQGLYVNGPSTGSSIADTAANIENLTAAQVSSLVAAGWKSATSTDVAVALSPAEAQLFAADHFSVKAPPGQSVGIGISNTALMAMTPAAISALSTSVGSGVTSILTSGFVSLTAAQAVALEGTGLSLIPAPGSSLGLELWDTSAGIEALTPSQIAGLPGLSPFFGYAVHSSDTSLVLTPAQAAAFASIQLHVPYGDTISLSDTAAGVEALTPAQITSLVLNYSAITVTSGSVVLTAAQALALEGATTVGNYPVSLLTTPPNSVSVSDTAAALEALSPDQIARMNVNAVTATDGPVAFTVAQAQGIQNRYYLQVPAGTQSVIADTAANIKALLDQTPGTVSGTVQFLQPSALVATDGPLALTVAEIENLQSTEPNLVLRAPAGAGVTITDTAADIQAMSVSQMQALSTMGVTGIVVTDASLTLTVAQALALYDPVPITTPPGTSVIIADTEAAIAALTPANLEGLAAIGVKEVDVSNISGSTTLNVDGGITLSISGAVPPTEVINFAGTGGTLVFNVVSGAPSAIDGFSPGDQIVLKDLTYDSADNSLSASLQSNNSLLVTVGGANYVIQLDPNQVFLTPPTFQLSAAAGGGVALTVTEPALTTNDAANPVSSGATSDGLVIANGGVVTADGAINRVTVDGGQLTVQSDGASTDVTVQNAGDLQVQAGGTVSNVTLQNGGILDLSTGGAASGLITFSPVAAGGQGGTLIVDDGSAPSATISGFGAGDTINLGTLDLTGASFSFDPATDILTIQTPASGRSAGAIDTLNLVGNFTSADFQGVGDLLTVSCFFRGTHISTPDGERKVENLKAGDLVVTTQGLAAPVKWLGRQTVSTRFSDPLRVLPIRVRKGALGENIPARDLLLSPDHALLIGEVLIQAGALVNGSSVVREEHVPEVFTYFHLELADHSLILAENAPAETFIDNVDRLGFDNWQEHQALYAECAPLVEMPFPRAKSRRQVPSKVRALLEARAQVLDAKSTFAAA